MIIRMKTPEIECRQLFKTTDWTNWKPIMEWIDGETTQALLDKDGVPMALMFVRKFSGGAPAEEKVYVKIGDYIAWDASAECFYVITNEMLLSTYEVVRVAGIEKTAAVPDAICDTCGSAKDTHALGEKCSYYPSHDFACGGTVIANPALESQDPGAA